MRGRHLADRQNRPLHKMRELFKKLSALPASERRFAAEAWLLAPAVELSLATLGLRRTLEAIDRLTPAKRRDGASVSAARGEQLVAATYRRHLVRGQCLPRALLQYAVHRRSGHEVRLVIGVRPPRASNLEAHAWVEDVRGPEAPSREQGYEHLLTRESHRRPAA